MPLIGIVDYHMGNLGSIANMLKRIGADAIVSSMPDELERADKLILPGVGSFDRGIANITELGLKPFLEDAVQRRRVPLLGICLGMQLLGKRSEEGTLSGLSWIDAEAVRFRPDSMDGAMKVPHMG